MLRAYYSTLIRELIFTVKPIQSGIQIGGWWELESAVFS